MIDNNIMTFTTVALLAVLIIGVTAFALRLAYEVHPAAFIAAAAVLALNVTQYTRAKIGARR